MFCQVYSIFILIYIPNIIRYYQAMYNKYKIPQRSSPCLCLYHSRKAEDTNALKISPKTKSFPKLLSLPQHLSSPQVFSGVRVTPSLDVCIVCVFCRSLVVLLYFFFWSIVLSVRQSTVSDYTLHILTQQLSVVEGLMNLHPNFVFMIYEIMTAIDVKRWLFWNCGCIWICLMSFSLDNCKQYFQLV